MKKMIIAGAITLFLAGTWATPSIDTTHAATTPNIMVDGKSAATPLKPFYAGDNLYIPVRVLEEFFPGTLKWDNTKKQLNIIGTGTTSVLIPGSESIQWAGGPYRLDSQVLLRQGHVYIPVTALNTLTGADSKLNTAKSSLEIQSGNVSSSVRTPAEPLAVAKEDAEVKLYAALKEGNMYKGYILEAGGSKHPFAWESPRFVQYPPELYYTDINNDRQPEIIVILTLGTGTGIVEQELHVVNSKTWTETVVPKAYEAARTLVASTITKDKEDALVNLVIKGSSPSTVSIRMPGRAEDISNLGTSAGYGAVTYYSVEAGKLTAKTSVNVGFVESIGTLKLVYKDAKNGMEADSITFIPFDEYPASIKKQ
ncbi:hypothetical protein J7E73_32650 [Paenibacillus albidus]|uniref:stalk domain-containing protein n=1 Tax=Paenibacillus albidus TaxID=2041023 RepID=UPI001BE6F8DB|nr:stalk domain-containing protein [Paenibacillus albidus]MBT2293763.1 hypothetical protein [Paenibacillus albidus]